MVVPYRDRSASENTGLAIARTAEQAVETGDGASEPLLDILRTRLQREHDAGLRLRLARAYLRLLRTAGLSLAVHWARGDEPMLREAAYDALHDLGDQALPALLELVESRDPAVRWCAYEVAEHLHRPAVVPILARGLRDEEAENRWAASNGLVAMGSRAFMPVLVALVTQPATLTFHAAARRVLVRLDLAEYGVLALRLLDSLAHATTTVQSGPIAAELLAIVRAQSLAPAPAARPHVARNVSVQTPQGSEITMTTKPATSIRAASPADAAAVQSLWKECGLAPARDEEWSALASSPMSAILVAELDGRIVGGAVATFDGWRAYVYHVAVSPSFRGHGAGHDLMAAVEDHLQAVGARYAYVAVHEDNTEGLALAVSSGYLPEGERMLTKSLETK
ncbi:MAG: GNAT family N-acetyltransferase [Dehalococcoidia bacterium]